jgi:hypothetical protein
MYVKNSEPYRRPKYWEIQKIREFWEKASPQQQRIADEFSRDYWLVEACKHNNRRDWFLTFERTVHLFDENDNPIQGNSQKITVCITPTGRQKHYRRHPQTKDY